jgi:hypothetical protein
MRRRKPCVLARRRLFGWKVRLLTRFSVGCRGPSDVTTTSVRLPLWGCRWPMRPQSASPWRAEGAGWAGLGAMGMRKRSQTRSVNDTGAVERGSNRRSRPERADQNSRSSKVPRRLQADTPSGRRSVDDSIVTGEPAAVGFRLSRSSPPHAQAVDKRVDNRASFTRTRTDPAGPTPAHSSPCSRRTEPGSQQAQRN